MLPEGSLPYSQEPATGAYYKLSESISYPPSLLLMYALPDIIKMVKSRTVRWGEYEVQIWREVKCTKVLIGKP
jgi:hypothetical protein